MEPHPRVPSQRAQKREDVMDDLLRWSLYHQADAEDVYNLYCRFFAERLELLVPCPPDRSPIVFFETDAPWCVVDHAAVLAPTVAAEARRFVSRQVECAALAAFGDESGWGYELCRYGAVLDRFARLVHTPTHGRPERLHDRAALLSDVFDWVTPRDAARHLAPASRDGRNEPGTPFGFLRLLGVRLRERDGHTLPAAQVRWKCRLMRQ